MSTSDDREAILADAAAWIFASSEVAGDSANAAEGACTVSDPTTQQRLAMSEAVVAFENNYDTPLGFYLQHRQFGNHTHIYCGTLGVSELCAVVLPDAASDARVVEAPQCPVCEPGQERAS